MNIIDKITQAIIKHSQTIFGNNLVGIYLHGSAVMGCFNEKSSDIDIIIVINTTISTETKHRFMDMIVELNKSAPKKGIELSIVKKDVCKPFIYPTPFELHFSITHLNWYQLNPLDYIDKMTGTDKDLAAHFNIIYHRGRCLFGKDIKEVFENINPKYYFDSIWNDIENAQDEIIKKPTYIILNLCRVLAYKKDELILSKQEGGNWGIANLPKKYHDLILCALNEYIFNISEEWNKSYILNFAKYMIEQIKT